MSTLSIPLTEDLESFIEQEIRIGRAENKAAVVRRALRLLREEEAIRAVLEAERELGAGKVLRGDLKKLARELP